MNQSDEVQQQVENHSLQDISNTVTEEEKEDAVRGDTVNTEASRPVKEKTMELKS